MDSQADRRSPSHGFFTQMVKFAGVGAIGTAAQYVILIVAVEVFGGSAVLFSVLGFVAGALVNYTLNYYFTFRSNKKHSETAAKFFIIAAIGMAINGGIMHLAVEGMRLHYVASQIAATGIVFFWNYIANRIWTFRH